MNKIGKIFVTNEGYEVEVIEYFNNINCTIRFKDGTTLYNKVFKQVKGGAIKNPYHKSVYNIGYYGVGKYRSKINGQRLKHYEFWAGMFNRCYSKKFQERHPTYKDCTVAEEWHNFQNFAEWFEENWKPHMQRWQLDKDILLKGNKIYSPETCAFVPSCINNLFVKCDNSRGEYPIGVQKLGNKFKVCISINRAQLVLGSFATPEEAFQAYKTAKEEEIKRIADEWREQIDPRVYQAMINYKVEIND